MEVLRNILAVVLGLIIGSMVNMGIIMISGNIIPPPAGSNLTTMEGLKEAMQNMEAKHFIMPFLAHALGTLVGAMVAILVAAKSKMTFAWVIAICFFVGGLINIFILPAPMWFNIVDVVFAYFPMAWLAGRLTKII